LRNQLDRSRRGLISECSVRCRHVPTGGFGLSCFSTFGVWPLTLPARASEPCTLPCTPGGESRKGTRHGVSTCASKEPVALQSFVAVFRTGSVPSIAIALSVRKGPCPLRQRMLATSCGRGRAGRTHSGQSEEYRFAASSRRPACSCPAPFHAHGTLQRIACLLARPPPTHRRGPIRPVAIAHPSAHPRAPPARRNPAP